nr:MAG TPA: hypothetical protein [Bacteriophage sp.]
MSKPISRRQKGFRKGSETGQRASERGQRGVREVVKWILIFQKSTR